jgi:hypothetical protein
LYAAALFVPVLPRQQKKKRFQICLHLPLKLVVSCREIAAVENEKEDALGKATRHHLLKLVFKSYIARLAIKKDSGEID